MSDRIPPPLFPSQPPPPRTDVAAAAQRLRAQGGEALSAIELLTLVLGPGGRRRDAARLARRVLARFGDPRRLAAARPAELAPLLGEDLGLRLVAAFGLARRAHAVALTPGVSLARSNQVFEAYGERLRDLKKERFLSLLLDGRSRVIREDLVSEGTLTASLVHPREVFGPAIREAANALVLVHNHPSGDPEPSPEDVEITRRLASVGDLVGIRIADHVVIGDGRYVSFLERGLLP